MVSFVILFPHFFILMKNKENQSKKKEMLGGKEDKVLILSLQITITKF